MKESNQFKGDAIAKMVAIFLLFLWLVPAVNAQITQQEREALIALYEATDGDNWNNNDNWKVDGEFNDSGTEDTWHGVTVENDVVTSLRFHQNNLTGSVPTDLAGLTGLKALVINNLNSYPNELTGEIPAELGGLSNLTHLEFVNTSVSGEIPPELGNLSELAIFRVTTLNLTGTLPPEFGNLSKLRTLWIQGSSDLTGEIPSELGNMTSLRELVLTNSGFTGEIFSTIGNLSDLERLSLSGNNFTGEIPGELGDLTNLHTLSLARNNLTGEIPPELNKLENLIYLSLWDNELSGEIPAEFWELSNLEDLSLNENSFEGEIPREVENLFNLKDLLLSGNNFSGIIPAELGSLSNLDRLVLSGNNFTGEIPAEFGNLSNVRVMSLSDNHLTGEIPSELGNLSNLIFLELHANQLSGKIPSSIANLENLSSAPHVNFNYNMLSATDPDVQDFLDLKDPGWDQTQTVAPKDIIATTGSENAINVNWTPIPYEEDGGKYIVHYGTSPGTYTDSLMTEDKTTSEIDLNDLDPGSSYYIAVQTYTPSHENNPNELISTFSTETDVQVESVTLQLREGWNLIGSPFDLPEQTHAELFETVVGNLFGYESGYNEQEFLKFSTGYWLRSDDEAEVELSGWLPSGERTISLKEGWNMISGSLGSMDISAISDPDEILLQGTLYGYSVDYVQSDTLEPGRGYWVRTSSEGEIILPEEPSPKQLTTGATTTSWGNGFLEEFDKLVFYTEGEDTRINRPIYFGGELPDEIHPLSLSRPPVGPGMVMDARIENDLYATTADTVRIRMKSSGQPIYAVLQPSQPLLSGNYVMVEYTGENLIRTSELQEQTELRLADSSVDRIELYRQEENIITGMPDEFDISQNYPNPFNPATVISYQLPDAVHVRLEVFNITGRRIAVLVDREQQAGSYNAVFDGSNLASGTYLYRIRAGGFDKTRKFTLIK